MNKRFSILVATALFISSLSLFISCGGDEGDDPKPEMKATSIELVSGGNQTAIVETTLENPVIVLVKDQEGNVFAGETVKFASSISVGIAVTDANGKANITWTLGASEGTQTLTITGTSSLTGSPLSITATAIHKPIIGEFYEGGVVFYIDETGAHGLVCAVRNFNQYIPWGCKGTEITGADGTAVGTGAQNTLDILAGCNTAGTAADSCANLSINGFNDWFLPSQDELNLIFVNRVTIETTAIENGGESFADTYYWTSTQYPEYNYEFAYYQNFKDAEQNGSYKDNTCQARAVRTF
jgi:hypothetical protein